MKRNLDMLERRFRKCLKLLLRYVLRYRALITLIILTLIVLGIFFGREALLLNFPFYSDVWGTAGDWTMITVTAITAYFLWRTLDAQMEVLSTQKQVLKIETERHKRSLRPDIRFEKYVKKDKDKHKKDVLNNKFTHTLKFILISENNFASDIKVSVCYDDLTEEEKQFYSSNELEIKYHAYPHNDNTPFKKTIEIYNICFFAPSNTENQKFYSLKFWYHYTDIEGNGYRYLMRVRASVKGYTPGQVDETFQEDKYEIEKVSIEKVEAVG